MENKQQRFNFVSTNQNTLGPGHYGTLDAKDRQSFNFGGVPFGSQGQA